MELLINKLAGQEGLEPPTNGFGDRRSTIGATGLERYDSPNPNESRDGACGDGTKGNTS